MDELYPEVMRSGRPHVHLTVIATRWLVVPAVLSAAALAVALRRAEA